MLGQPGALRFEIGHFEKAFPDDSDKLGSFAGKMQVLTLFSGQARAEELLEFGSLAGELCRSPLVIVGRLDQYALCLSYIVEGPEPIQG